MTNAALRHPMDDIKAVVDALPLGDRQTVGMLMTHLTAGCLRCGVPWGCVTAHFTCYRELHGCFPLCNACWAELRTPEARLPFYERQSVRWQDHAEEWPLIEEAVRAGK